MSKIEEILDKHLSLMVGRAEQSYVSVDEMKKQPEYQATKDAMLEFGKFLLEEAAENAKTIREEEYDNRLGEYFYYDFVDKQSIINTLNKYL